MRPVPRAERHICLPQVRQGEVRLRKAGLRRREGLLPGPGGLRKGLREARRLLPGPGRLRKGLPEAGVLREGGLWQDLLPQEGVPPAEVQGLLPEAGLCPGGLREGLPQAGRLREGLPQAGRLREGLPQAGRLREGLPQADGLREGLPQADGLREGGRLLRKGCLRTDLPLPADSGPQGGGLHPRHLVLLPREVLQDQVPADLLRSGS